MNDETKKTIVKNSKKGYMTRNIKIVNDKYFSVNNSVINSFNDNVNISFGDSGSNVNFLSPEKVLGILKGKNNFQKQRLINDLSDFFYNTNGVYANLIEKVAAIPSFDRVIARGKKDKLKKHYIDLLRIINDKYVGKDALRTYLRNGNYFGYLSYLEKNDNANGTEKSTSNDELQLVAFSDASIIPLSSDYTRILSTDGKTYRVGIDVSQLNEMDLAGFPREIYQAVKNKRDAYNQAIKNKKKNTNIFAQQYFILDERRTIVLKSRASVSESTGRPFFITLIVELIHDINIRNKKAKLLSKTGKDLIYETYPEGSKGKGTSSLTQKQMDSQHDFIAEALNDLSTYTETSMVSIHPGTKLDKLALSNDFNNINSEDIIKRIGTHSGISMGFLNGENLKSDKTLAYLYEIMGSEIDDFMVQYEKELNKVIRFTVSSKQDIDMPYISYLPTNRLNRKEYVEMYHRTFADAGGSYQLYLASTGILPEIQLNLMEEEEELNFRKKFPAHPMASTSSWSSDNEKSEKEVDKKVTKKEEIVEDEEKVDGEKNE